MFRGEKRVGTTELVCGRREGTARGLLVRAPELVWEPCGGTSGVPRTGGGIRPERIFKIHREGPVRDLDWIERHKKREDHCEAVDVTNGWSVIGVMGPQSRAVLGGLTDADLSNDGFPFGTAQKISVGGATVRALEPGQSSTRFNRKPRSSQRRLTCRPPPGPPPFRAPPTRPTA